MCWKLGIEIGFMGLTRGEQAVVFFGNTQRRFLGQSNPALRLQVKDMVLGKHMILVKQCLQGKSVWQVIAGEQEKQGLASGEKAPFRPGDRPPELTKATVEGLVFVEKNIQ